MSYTEQSYIGKGPVFAREYGVAEKMRDIGNVTALNLAIAQEEKSLLNYRTSGGGKLNQLQRITGVSASITLSDFSPENLALALYGSTAAVTATTVTDEEQTGYADGLVPTDHQIDTAETVTVKAKDGVDASAWAATTAYGGASEPVYAIPTVANTYYYKATTAGTSGSSEPTWPTTEGATVVDGTVTWTCMGLITRATTEYTVRAAGVELAGTSLFEDGRTLQISYTKDAGSLVQALVNSAKSFEMVFDGLNEAQSDKPVTVTLHKVKFSPAQSLDLIGDDFGSIQITGEVLLDTTITTAGLSQYLKIAAAA